MRIRIKVKTNQPNPDILNRGDYYEVFIKAKPEKGKANLEIIKLFKKKLKQDVRIVSGSTSKEKVLEII